EEEQPRPRRRLRAARAVLDDPLVAVRVRIEDEEAVVPRVAGVEDDRKQPLLAAARDLAAKVEERPRLEAAALDDPDRPRLLDDVQPLRLRRDAGDVGRRREAGEQQRRLRRGRGRLLARGDRDRAGDGGEAGEHAGQVLKRTRRSSSSLPGGRIASTWWPTSSRVVPSAISNWPFRLTEIRRDPSGSAIRSIAAPAAAEPFG